MANVTPVARCMQAVALGLVACGPPPTLATGADDASSETIESSGSVRFDLAVTGDGRDLPATGGDPTPDPDRPPEHVVVWDDAMCGARGRICLVDDTRVEIGFYVRALFDLDVDGDLDAVGVAGIGQWLARASSPWTYGIVDLGYGDGEGGVLLDVDGDGDRDIVALRPTDVVVSRFDGSGFLFAERWPLGERNYAPTRADVDGDGRDDLIFVDADTDLVAVVTSIPSATGPQVSWFPAGANPLDVAAADLDGDADIDLVVASPNSDSLEVLRGVGGGGLEPWTSVPTADSPRSVVVADFDGDDDLDLASADHDAAMLTIALADAGDWVPTSIAAPCPEPRDLVAVALDDGVVDLVVRSPDAAALFLLAGAGDGTFASAGSYPGEWDEVSVVDIGDDGELEVLAAGSYAPTVALQGHDLHVVGGYPGVGRGEIVDGDLYVIGREHRMVRQVAAGAGPRVFPAAKPVDPSFVADLDDDGAMDLVGRYEGRVATLANDGAQGFGVAVLTDVVAEDVGASRLDDDAWPDAIARDDAECVALHGDGAFGFVARPLDLDCEAARFGDADGDGRTDVFEIEDGVARISRLDDGVLVPWISGAAPDMTPVFVGDIDGDGVADVAARRGCCRLFVWSALSDAGIGDAWQLVMTENDLDGLALEDVDGDGQPELLSRHNALWVIAPEGDTWVASRLSDNECEWTWRHDVDNDGVMDLLRPHTAGLQVCASGGR